ncbi:carbohydrate ABC transporter permease [Microbacterium immunditiarum]|uniref:Multiple sugar transport system permease protein n=1 Tax=Microbacterium immunditiarum TaxID=337480 RepID=A0A7Y9GKK7_9MICO|nr:carbohydrate ABC transporter permease [Microbacterium immunditiarum]NYE18198.1 multiple sugar transport system permease protein [Microbacterium immunditiarum]
MTLIARGARRTWLATTLRIGILSLGALVMVAPFLYMVSISFTESTYVLTTPPQFIPDPATLANYEQALMTQGLPLAFANSLYIAAISTAVSLLISSMMAYAFARFSFPGRELIFRILLVGLMIPAVMLLIPQFILAKHLALLDSHLGLIVFYVAGSLALNTLLLRGFFEAIPGELDQAMQVDGANAWTRYWRLAIPLARPGLATAAIFTFFASWDEFAWALTIINTPELRTLPIVIRLFAGAGNNAVQWGLVFAASVIAIIPVIVVFLAFQRHFVQGLTSGAVKG